MDDDQQATRSEEPRSALVRWGRPGAFVAAGLVAGGLLAGSLTASAADTPTTDTESSSGTATAPPLAGGGGDPSQPQRSDEERLTGSTADKVQAAALAKYPGATVIRIESDSDGVYEAHLTTADGQPVTVEVDESFAVTGTEQGGPGGTGGPGQQSAVSGTGESGYGT